MLDILIQYYSHLSLPCRGPVYLYNYQETPDCFPIFTPSPPLPISALPTCLLPLTSQLNISINFRNHTLSCRRRIGDIFCCPCQLYSVPRTEGVEPVTQCTRCHGMPKYITRCATWDIFKTVN